MGAIAPFIPLISSGVGALGGWLANRGKSSGSSGGASGTDLSSISPWDTNYTRTPEIQPGLYSPSDVADVGRWLELMVPRFEGLSSQAEGHSGALFDESALNLAKSRTALDPVLQRYLSALTGSPTEFAAKDLGDLAAQQKAAKESVMLGPRGVAQDAALMQVPSIMAGQTAGAFRDARERAAAGATGIGQFLASQGLTAAQLGGTELGRAIEAMSQGAQVRQAGGGLLTNAMQGGLEQRGQTMQERMGVRGQNLTARGQDVDLQKWAEQLAAMKSAGNRGLLGSIIGGIGGPLLNWGLGKASGGSRGDTSGAPTYDWGGAGSWG
jgi:hypothetical protein